MKKIILSVIATLFLISSTPALAGAKKTAEALGKTVAAVEASVQDRNPELEAALKKAREISKNYWRMARHEVYRDAGKVYDDLIVLTNGSKAKISKPDWLP